MMPVSGFRRPRPIYRTAAPISDSMSGPVALLSPWRRAATRAASPTRRS